MPLDKSEHDVLASIAGNLEHLANAARINLFYTEEERRDLINQYRQLAKACVDARNRTQDAGPKDQYTSFDERVRALGEEEARRITQPLTDAINASKQATIAFDAFRKDHPLIGKLLMGTTGA